MSLLTLLFATTGCQKLLGGEAAASSATGAPSASAPAAEAAHGDVDHEAPVAHASASASAPAHPKKIAHREHAWTYVGEKGPTHWGELDPKWEGCRTGKAQSPIDLPSKAESNKTSTEPLTIDYVDVPLRIQNNGHTIQVVNGGDSYILVGQKRFDLVQFHFHSPSEHTLGGERFPLEVHFVHKAHDGQLAVVGAFFVTGAASRELADLWKKAPREENDEPITVSKKSLDVSDIVSTKEGYYTYAGSLTTPPCSEGVRWFVLKHVTEVDKKTVDAFREWFEGRTNRPIQPVGDRPVVFASR